jgi:4-hydroxy-tetrahydrodipicolinate reductase
MTRIILSGCGGAMGRAITLAANERSDVTIVAGIDPNAGNLLATFPIFAAPSACSTGADIIVDFSHTSALPGLLDFATKKNLPIVLATTGYSDEEIDSIHNAAKSIPVFYTGNMSLGINLMQELCRIAARVLGGRFDIEIIEKHHNKKIDAPSGTALMLANSIADTLEATPSYEYNRQAKRERRSKNEIGLHAVRGGTIVGEQEVIIAGQDEVLTQPLRRVESGVRSRGARRRRIHAGKTRGVVCYERFDRIAGRFIVAMPFMRPAIPARPTQYQTARGAVPSHHEDEASQTALLPPWLCGIAPRLYFSALLRCLRCARA